jgi:hypothetical protein
MVYFGSRRLVSTSRYAAAERTAINPPVPFSDSGGYAHHRVGDPVQERADPYVTTDVAVDSGACDEEE